MRKWFLVIFILGVLSSNAFCQSVVWKGDTSVSFETHLWLLELIDAENLFDTTHQLAVRITTVNSVVELWVTDTKQYRGQHILYSYTVDDDTSTNAEYFSKKTAIPPDTAKKLIELMASYDLEYTASHPASSSEDDYLQTYLVEYYTPEYAFFRYLQIPSYESAPSPLFSFHEFVQKLILSLNTKKKLNEYIYTLPPGACYQYGPAYFICLKSRTIIQKSK